MTRFALTSAFAVGLAAVTLSPLGPAFAQGTPEQRMACEGDAQRLCGDVIPDEARTKSCLLKNRRGLTPACRAVFSRANSSRN